LLVRAGGRGGAGEGKSKGKRPGNGREKEKGRPGRNGFQRSLEWRAKSKAAVTVTAMPRKTIGKFAGSDTRRYADRFDRRRISKDRGPVTESSGLRRANATRIQ